MSISDEERQAHRFSTALTQLGWQATPEVIRGTDSSQESKAFLHKLAAAVKAKEKASTDSKPLSPTTLLPLVDFISSNFSSLVGDGPQLLPTDIIRASSSNLSLSDPTNPSASFVSVDELLATSKARAAEKSQASATLRQKLGSLVRSRPSLSSPPPPSLSSPPMGLSNTDSDEDWTTDHARLVSSLSSFLSEADAFSHIYTRELGVWCESLPPAPSTSKERFGERSFQSLAALERSRSLLKDLSTIRQAHEALFLSRPPLESYEPRALERIGIEAMRRAVELERQTDILERATAITTCQ